jgi:CHAT domain-containing protein
LRQQRGALLGRLNALEKQRREASDKKRPLEPILNEIKATETKLDELAAEIRRANPKFAALEYPLPMDAKQLAALLDDNTALVSFTLTNEQSVALVLDHKGKVGSAMLGKADDGLWKLLQETLAAVESGQLTRHAGQALHELYQKRFLPIEPLIQGKQRLIVLADGGLHLLPFEMLLTEEPKSDNPAEWSWLLKKYEIHYGPSGTILAQFREERKKSEERRAKSERRTLLAVADPPFSEKQLAEMKEGGRPTPSNDLFGVVLSRDVEARFRFDNTKTPPRLPGTRVEAQGIAKLLGEKSATLMLGADATDKRVWELSKSGELAKYRYIHFATHGWVDTQRPELSGLVLSLTDKSEDYDGLLQMREIFTLKLDADLVVLSACQTGRGKLMRGEGVVGLAQAFFYAGAPSLVVSLWNVNDASTALLMKRFYANLIERRMPKAAALREAKLWLMTLTEDDLKAEDKALAKTDTTRGLGAPVKSAPGAKAAPYSHPRHWAPFVLIGDSE